MIEVSLRLDWRQDLTGAVNRLRAGGMPERQIDILSRVPLPESVLPVPAGRMSKIGVIGALLGFSAAVALLVGMTLNYGLRTGGMPLLSPLPLGVITYEMTLLASILAMVATLFVSARLGPWRRVPEHPELDYGEAIVSVTCADLAQAQQARDILAAVAAGRP